VTEITVRGSARRRLGINAAVFRVKEAAMAIGVARIRSGDGTRRAGVIAVALTTVATLAAIVWTQGWAWTVAAWFGASAAAFAVSTARAGRAARDGERAERRLLDHAGRRSEHVRSPRA
jgi:uncharacterized membrane protein